MQNNLFNPEFYLKHGIKLIIGLTTLVATASYLIDYLNYNEFDVIHAVIVIDFLFAKESILITIAAVLIGIYFGIFTHLLTANINSALFSLNKKTLQELISFLKRALLAAFVYLFWALFHPYIYFESHLIHFIIELTLGVSVLYMFLTALQVGIAFIYIFTKDIDSLYDKLQNEHKKHEELNSILYKINERIQKEGLKESLDKAKKINQDLIHKNPNSKKK